MDDTKTLKQKICNFTTREQKLEQDKQELLHRQGWRHTSNFPDCCWRWVKSIDGHVVATVPSLNLDEALQLEVAYSERRT